MQRVIKACLSIVCYILIQDSEEKKKWFQNSLLLHKIKHPKGPEIKYILAVLFRFKVRAEKMWRGSTKEFSLEGDIIWILFRENTTEVRWIFVSQDREERWMSLGSWNPTSLYKHFEKFPSFIPATFSSLLW